MYMLYDVISMSHSVFAGKGLSLHYTEKKYLLKQTNKITKNDNKWSKAAQILTL